MPSNLSNVASAQSHLLHAVEDLLTPPVSPDGAHEMDAMPKLLEVHCEIERGTSQMFSLPNYVPKHLANTYGLHLFSPVSKRFAFAPT